MLIRKRRDTLRVVQRYAEELITLNEFAMVYSNEVYWKAYLTDYLWLGLLENNRVAQLNILVDKWKCSMQPTTREKLIIISLIDPILLREGITPSCEKLL